MPIVKLGMIGCGLISHAHANAARKIGNEIEFLAAVNPNIAKANSWGEKYGAKPFDNICAMIGEIDLDGVIIASPPHAHFENLMECINGGIKNILCEKPMFFSTNEARIVIKAAQKAKCNILEGYMYRHHSAFQKYLDKVPNVGPIDTISAIFNMFQTQNTDKTNWRHDGISGGVIYDFLCYPIDFSNLIAASKPLFATSIIEPNSNGGVEKIAGLVQYENGIIANIGASFKSSFSQSIAINGEKGILSMPVGFAIETEAKIEFSTSNGFINQSRTLDTIEPIGFEHGFVNNEAFKAQLLHFIQIVKGQAMPICNLNSALINGAVTDALIESYKSSSIAKINFEGAKI